MRMEQSDQNTGNQSVDLLLLKREVDALQVAVHGQQAPWYQNMPTVLSVVALLFSFGTTFVSYKRTVSQDIQNARVELRGLLQRLAALPRENVEFTKKYEKVDPAAVASISGSINQENALLARQAAEITTNLPPKYISATEYYAVGIAMQAAYNFEGAKKLAQKAIDVSTDLNDRVAALRMKANLLYLTGQPDAGRVEYQRALDVFSGFDKTGYDDFTKSSTHLWTELSWAFSEGNIGQKDSAVQHVANAERFLSGLPPGPGTDQLNGQVSQAKIFFAGAGGPPTASAALPLGGASPPLGSTR
jgi:tetratricopeptide (TPR) repeat protein